jgi:hypothetical protein
LGRGRNASEPIFVKLRARLHALGCLPARTDSSRDIGVLGAKFLLIDKIEGGDLARCDLSEAATSAALGRLMGGLVGEQVRRVSFPVNSSLC